MDNDVLLDPNRIECAEQLQQHFKLIQVKPGTKKPVNSAWNKSENLRILTKEEIAGYNIGILTGQVSNITVADVDNPALFSAFCRTYGFQVPQTYTVKTGSDGRHFYFMHLGGVKPLPTKIRKTLGFDRLADNAFAVAPYSIHPNGNLYEIIDNRLPVAPPNWLLGDLDRPEWKYRDPLNDSQLSIEIKSAIEHGAPKGQRSELMWQVLLSLISAGFSNDQLRFVFFTYPIGQKVLEKGDAAGDWLNPQIDKAQNYLKTQLVEPISVPKNKEDKLAAIVDSVDFEFGRNFSKEPPPVVPPLIEYLLPRKGQLVVIAPPGLGKSLLLTELAMRVGKPPPTGIFGLLDVPGVAKTVILQGENDSQTMQERIFVMTQADQNLAAGYKNVFIPGFNGRARCLGFHFRSPHFRNLVLKAKEITAADILVVDPLISFIGAEENNNTEIRDSLDALTQVVMEAEMAVMIAHHPGKSGINGVYTGRGASAIADWCTNLLTLEYATVNNTRCIKATVEKARNSAAIDPFYLLLNKHLIFELYDPFAPLLGPVLAVLQSLGGSVNTQKDFINAIQASIPNMSKGSAIKSIKEAVDQGYVSTIQGAKGSLKYQLL